MPGALRVKPAQVMAGAGVGSGVSDRGRRRYALDARRLGLALDPEADGDEETVRLDWESGTVVAG